MGKALDITGSNQFELHDGKALDITGSNRFELHEGPNQFELHDGESFGHNRAKSI